MQIPHSFHGARENTKAKKPAMHKRPTIKIVELMGSDSCANNKEHHISSPLLSSLNSAAPKQGHILRFLELNHILSPEFARLEVLQLAGFRINTW